MEIKEITEVKEITKDISIKDLINLYPFSIRYMVQKNIKCIPCGDPICGTLDEAATEKGFNDKEIQTFVDELRELSIRDN